MKRRVFLLATVALVGVGAFAARSVASAKPALWPLRGVVLDGPRAGRGPRRIPGRPVQPLRLRVTGSHPAGALERATYPP